MSSAEAPSAAVRTITPPFFSVEALEDVAQARALVVLEPARDAEALAARDVDDEAARERDLRRQPRALRLHRVLDDLDEDLLAAAEQVLDLAAVRAALELGADDLVDVQEAVLLEADVDERGLHPGQDVVDDALVDVARRSSGARGARGRPRRPGRPRARRRAARSTSTETSSSRFAGGSGGRRGGVRRRGRAACARPVAARDASLARLLGLGLLRLGLGLGLGLRACRRRGACDHGRRGFRARRLRAGCGSSVAPACGGRLGYWLVRSGRRARIGGALLG